MNDLFESELSEALHRRAEERTTAAPSLADLHHRARTTPAEVPAVQPNRGSRLLLGGVLAAVVAVVGLGAWQVLAEDETTRLIDPAESDPVAVDPDDPPSGAAGDGNDERSSTDQDGQVATDEGAAGGAATGDDVDIFLDGWFIATWNGSEGTWLRPTAEPDSTIQAAGIGTAIGDDLTTATEAPPAVAIEACLIPGQETWMIDEPGVENEGLRTYADRQEAAELLPRPVVEISPQPAHVADVAEVLSGTGLEPNITRVVRFDQDGDGVDEVLIEANTRAGLANAYGGDDDYSLLLLRRVGSDGEVETVRIHEAYGDDEQPFLFWVTIAAVADVNGDGSFELLTRDEYFEGLSRSLRTIEGTPELVAQGGCGA